MNLYIHVPFCKSKCNYCAFHSTCPTDIDWDKYTDEILEQLIIHNSEFLTPKNTVFQTVFFGGGTPSLMPVKYFEKIRRAVTLASNAEWTVEANPKTISSYDLLALKDFGVNRLSVGMQGFDDEALTWMGRIHSAKDATDLIESAAASGLRVSADFIYGFGGCDTRALCEKINKLPIEHASLYELTIEDGTSFANMRTTIPLRRRRAGRETDGVVERLKISKNDEELARDYETIQTILRLPRYEVSNYGEPCRHNAAVWAGEQYIGIGESAAGRIILPGIGKNDFSREVAEKKNRSLPDVWAETKITGGRLIMTELSPAERAIEMVMTGLRTMRGVDVAALPAQIINNNFVTARPEYFAPPTGGDTHLKMTDRGLLLLDSLLSEIIL